MLGADKKLVASVNLFRMNAAQGFQMLKKGDNCETQCGCAGVSIPLDSTV